MSLDDAAQEEVLRQHRVIEGWLTASLPDTDDTFVAFAGVLAPEFHIIQPVGVMRSRSEMVTAFRARHGAMPSTFRVEIRGFQPRVVTGKFCLATYEEWQIGEETTARQSSVLLRANSGMPAGVEWLHLHETWLPGRATGVR